MDIIIQSLGFKTGDTLEGFINEKVGALKSDNIVRANVTLFMGPDNNPDNNYCEIRLEVPGNDLFVKKNGTHFETAVSECVDILTQKISKAKDKNTDRLKADAEIVQDTINESDVNEDDMELEDVVK